MLDMKQTRRSMKRSASPRSSDFRDPHSRVAIRSAVVENHFHKPLPTPVAKSVVFKSGDRLMSPGLRMLLQWREQNAFRFGNHHFGIERWSTSETESHDTAPQVVVVVE